MYFPPALHNELATRLQKREWYCTDCDEPRGVLTKEGRCRMCGGARIIRNEE